MAALRIGPGLEIPDHELSEQFVRSSGAGGQNVNKVASKVELRWNLLTSQAVSERDRNWLAKKLAHALTQAGELVISASESRDQIRNRENARKKLQHTLATALVRPKRRVATKPTKGAVRRRLSAKRENKDRKTNRRWTPE